MFWIHWGVSRNFPFHLLLCPVGLVSHSLPAPSNLHHGWYAFILPAPCQDKRLHIPASLATRGASEMEADLHNGGVPREPLIHSPGRHVLCSGPFLFPVVWIVDEIPRAAVATLQPHGDLENRSYTSRI